MSSTGTASVSESSPSSLSTPADVTGLDLEPGAVLDGDPEGDLEAGDPLASFRESQQQAAADFQTRIRQSQTAVRSGGGGGKLKPKAKARKSEPKKQAVSAAGDEEQSDMYLGTQQRGGEQSLRADFGGSDVSQGLGGGLLLPSGGGVGKGAAAHAVSSADALTAGATTATADPVEGTRCFGRSSSCFCF